MANYVIITPAHNEATFIAKTINSMVLQTRQPKRWVVVNDASTDGTGKIVDQHEKLHGFIKLVNVERPPGRHFGNKVTAFNKGLEMVQGLRYEYVGNLDADISLEPSYFEKLLYEFERDPELGIAGGMVHTNEGGRYVSQEVALDSVAGAVQLFRRECFEQIGGYIALPCGGIDAAAEIMARQAGWKTRTFPEYRVLEHRMTGSATARPMGSRVKEGRRLHSLGYAPEFFVARCVNRLKSKPRIVGSFGALFGYFSNVLRGEPIALPPEVVRQLRLEQREKLKRMLRLPAYSRTTSSLSTGRS
jgi:glycosyltransferase involved in cell wall biosynthesis